MVNIISWLPYCSRQFIARQGTHHRLKIIRRHPNNSFTRDIDFRNHKERQGGQDREEQQNAFHTPLPGMAVACQKTGAQGKKQQHTPGRIRDLPSPHCPGLLLRHAELTDRASADITAGVGVAVASFSISCHSLF